MQVLYKHVCLLLFVFCGVFFGGGGGLAKIAYFDDVVLRGVGSTSKML